VRGRSYGGVVGRDEEGWWMVGVFWGFGRAGLGFNEMMEGVVARRVTEEMER